MAVLLRIDSKLDILIDIEEKITAVLRAERSPTPRCGP